MNVLIIWLGLLYFCFISPSLSKSVRIPAPPVPPDCDPSVSTKYRCIADSCTCGWCLSEDKHQTRKSHEPMGNCFLYSNHPAYIERKCGSVNSTVHTHINSKMCHTRSIIILTLLGVWFAAIAIACIVGFIRICCFCYQEQNCDVPISTFHDEL